MDKVNIREVSFTRKFNLGNYETCDYSLTASIGPDDDVTEVMRQLDAYTIKLHRERTANKER